MGSTRWRSLRAVAGVRYERTAVEGQGFVRTRTLATAATIPDPVLRARADDEPKLFMDHDNVSLGKPGTNGRMDLSLYSSFTVRQGRPVLWYPDRKFFLLGRVIGNEWVARSTR